MASERKEKLRVAVFISGRGSNLDALLRAIEEERFPAVVVVVISDKASAPGLGIAKSFQVPTIVVPRRSKERTEAQFSESLIYAVSGYKPDLIVLAGFMRVIQPDFIRHFKNRIINIHPSLLPAFRGLHAQEQTLQAAVKFAGCTVHYVVEEIDAGPIIGQAVVPVLPLDTAADLAARILKAEHKLLPACIAAIAHGEIFLTQENGGNVVHFADSLSLLEESICLFNFRQKRKPR